MKDSEGHQTLKAAFEAENNMKGQGMQVSEAPQTLQAAIVGYHILIRSGVLAF
jgi:hypothetical protein